jgi:cytochrome bd-type quinol oxidase subunit 1
MRLRRRPLLINTVFSPGHIVSGVAVVDVVHVVVGGTVIVVVLVVVSAASWRLQHDARRTASLTIIAAVILFLYF